MKLTSMSDPLSRKVQPLKHRKRRKPLSQEIKSMYRILSVVLFLFATVSTGLFLYMNSQKAVMGYQLEQLRLEFNSLSSSQRALDHQVIEAQSFLYLDKDEQLNKMQEIDNEDFTFVHDDTGLAQQ